MRTADILEPPLYLFQCNNDASLFAVSVERSAGNIPLSTVWYGGWSLRSELTLGLNERAPTGIDFTPILRGVRSVGYYIWRNGLA